MADKRPVALIGPVVWGSVWGHGPELASHLAGSRRVEWYDPLTPPSPGKASFRDRGAYPSPDGLTVIRRRSRLRPGPIYGLAMELRNLWAVLRRRPAAAITYYPVGSLLAMAWCRLTGIRSLFIYADRPEIISSPLARRAAGGFGLAATARLATAGSIATSGPLLEDLLEVTRRAVLIPNGVNLERIERMEPSTGGGRSDRFTVAFAGAFGDWVDTDLVLETARRRPEAGFVLIGDGPRWEETKTAAAALENVTLTGALAHREVFARLAEADIGLVPFEVNGLTDRVCPVKLFEYWAMGLPVVATPCRELKRLAGDAPSALRLAADAGETVSSIDRLREDPDELAAASRQAREAVAAFDWKLLGRRIEDLLWPACAPAQKSSGN